MASDLRVLYFSDQTVDLLESLSRLSSLSRKSSILTNFLQSAIDVINHASTELPLPERNIFPVKHLEELSQWQHELKLKNAAVYGSILCTAQIGWWLIHADRDPQILTPSPGTIALGLCTGSLAAIAIAAVNNVMDLLRIAPDVVRLAFKVGLAAEKRASSLENAKGCWAAAVSGLSYEGIESVLDVCYTKVNPSHRRVYISATTCSSFTLSGPPSSLRSALADLAKLPGVCLTELSLSAPYHAEHLPLPDIDSILGDNEAWNMAISTQNRFMSSHSGILIEEMETLRDLLHHALIDVFQRPLNVQAVAKSLKLLAGHGKLQLVTVGPCNVGRSFVEALAPTQVDEIGAGMVTELHASLPKIKPDAVAVIGMAGRFPGADSLDEFWNILENGIDTCKKVTPDRFDVQTHCDPTGKVKNTTLTPYGCFVDRPDLFDARLFKLSPREVAQTDPIHRLLLITAYEALEMAGYSPNRTVSESQCRIATFYGQSSDDWREVNAGQDIDTFHITGGIRAFGPGRLNYHFGWEGPSASIDAACSGSALSIQLACSALRSRECSMALAGGGNLMTASDLFAGLSRGNFLSPTGSCKTWDASADGYCRADAVATVVLKRLEDAIRDNDTILGVIDAVATNHSAKAVSITHPDTGTQQKLFREVLRTAGIEPNEVDFVEMHGTGTQAGDCAEANSVTEVFGNARNNHRPLFVGTVKPNLGHGEAASGVTSVMKALMMMRKSMIPRHIGIKSGINTKLSFGSSSSIVIPLENMPFVPDPKGDGIRRVLVNNFNATGGNTSLVLEDFPAKERGRAEDPRKSHVVSVSAATPNSFKANLRKLADYLIATPQINLADLSYTTTARRMHHAYRFTRSVGSTRELIGEIERQQDMADGLLRVRKPADVVFTFTGQASQYAGMGSQLFHTSKLFREHICSSNAICLSFGFPSFIDLIVLPNLEIGVYNTIQHQLALVALELALAYLWISWGVQPAIVIGHSLGEYAALCIAGVMTQTDTLYLVGSRAQLMMSKCISGDHRMVAIKCSVKDFQSSAQIRDFKTCKIACINGSNAIVVGGPSADIDALTQILHSTGVKVLRLSTPYAFHSAQMDAIVPEFEALAQTTPFSRPQVPVASTLLGSMVKDEGVFTAQYLARQVREPVQFVAALAACKSQLKLPGTMWLEVGPKPSCLSMIRSSEDVPEEMLLTSLDEKKEAWMTLSTSISKAFEQCIPVAWTEYHREYEECLNLLELPSYAFDLKSYWIQYEGDWCIRKAQSKQNPLKSPTLLSTTLHAVKSENLDASPKSITFASDLSNTKLRSIIRGHLVNEQGLCPSSVYADMAMTAALYLWRRLRSSEEVPALNVSNMEVSKPLIVPEKKHDANHFVILEALDMADAGTVQITISSSQNEETETHASCIVKYGKAEDWMDSWKPNAYLYQSRIDHLIESATYGRVHKILKPMAYKLFASLVKYDESYQGMEQIFLDSQLKEATAKISLHTQYGAGEFYCSPRWIDSLAHLSGFVLNGSDTTPDDTVYISHGWRSMRLTRHFSENATYSTYTRMQPVGSKGLMVGDVHIFEGDLIIGVIEGLKFQAIKKSILGSLLPGQNGDKFPKQSYANRTHPRVPMANQTTTDRDNRQVLFHQVLDILASELGVDSSELCEDGNLHDLGVDSILSISALGKLRQITQIDLPSSLFTAYPTIGELKSFFGFDGPVQTSSESNLTDSYNSELEGPSDSSSQITSDSSNAPLDMAEIFRATVAEEAGIDVTEIDMDTELSDLGLDSILGLSITSAFAEKTNVKLPSSFVYEHPTYRDALAFLRFSCHTESTKPPTRVLGVDQQLLPSHEQLQYTPGKGLPILFLLPDGSGSASSYVNLPKLHADLSVIAFNSPFQNSPTDYNLPLKTVAGFYVTKILQLQSEGPYIVGGWSIGGAYAYEVACQLMTLDKEVKGVVLIDSVCPQSLPSLPVETLAILRRIGIFDRLSKRGGTDGNISPSVHEHFIRSIAALKNYHPEPLSKVRSQRLKCWVIWARFGVLELMERSIAGQEMVDSLNLSLEEFNDIQRWLLVSRDFLGPGGWESLVSSGIKCVSVEGDHFSIMRKPAVESLGKAIGRAVTDMLED